MVDIHSHIIPAFDDGVTSLDEALHLLLREVEGGTTAIVATPHVNTLRELQNSSQILDRLASLRNSVAEAGIAIEIVSGAELYPSTSIIEAVNSGLPITVGNHGKHVLLDTPFGAFPLDFEHVLFELLTRGITPILAHPERASVFQHDLQKLLDLLERGVVCQINAGSVIGKYGEVAQRTVKKILDRHLAHFMASDAHRPGREPILNRTVRVLSNEVCPEYLTFLHTKSGQAIISGQALGSPPPAKPMRVRKPGIFSFLTRHKE